VGLFCLPIIQQCSGINSLLCHCQERSLSTLRGVKAVSTAYMSAWQGARQVGGWTGGRTCLTHGIRCLGGEKTPNLSCVRLTLSFKDEIQSYPPPPPTHTVA